MVENGKVKTNCDLMVEATYNMNNDSWSVVLMQGGFASAKTKLEMGLPVSCYYIAKLLSDGSVKNIACEFAYVSMDAEVDDRMWLRIGEDLFVFYSNNVIELD